MARIEETGRRYVELPKPKPKPQIPVQPKVENPVNANNLRAENNFFGSQQRLRLDNIFNNAVEERDNSALIGGTAGSTAAQFAQSEATLRNTQPILIRSDSTTPSNFVSDVTRDLQKLAPGTIVELAPTDPQKLTEWNNKYGANTAAIATPAPVDIRTSTNSQGYRLVDQLTANSNPVSINYKANNAYASAQNSSFGSVTNPGAGSAVNVFYDPSFNPPLSARTPDGQTTQSAVGSAVILGHELSHASHHQRGTRQNIDPLLAQQGLINGTGGKQNYFEVDGTLYVENDNLKLRMREEFRTVGVDGYRYGNEPTENSLRAEQGITDQRIAYQNPTSPRRDSSTGQFVRDTSTNQIIRDPNYTEVSRFQYQSGRINTLSQTFGDGVVDGVRNSRNSALIGGGFNAVTAIIQGKDTTGVLTDSAIGAGTGVVDEVIQRVVNGPSSTTSGMTANNFRAAASQVKGAAVAGAVINTGFAIYDQMDNLQNDATRSQAVGVIAGEAVVGAASGAAGAYAGAMAGAAIGSIVPGVGTVIGGIVGFAAGAAVGYLADKGLRGLGVNEMVAQGVTTAYDTVSNAASTVTEGAKNLFSGATQTLSSIFG